MKIKTSELSGVALDWAVAKSGVVTEESNGLSFEQFRPYVAGNLKRPYRPSTDWSQGGPLIEREQIDLEWDGVDGQAYWWKASHQDIAQFQISYTPLIAACRAIVAAKLGDEVDVPEGLV